MEEDYLKEYREMQKVLQIDDQELLFFLIACKHDIILLDKVVGRMNNGSGQLQRNANNTLTELKEHPDAWTIVGPILALSQNQQTKYYALQILENGILIRWAGLPQLRTFGRSYQSRNEREGIRKYIVDLIIETYSGLTLADDGKPYRRKLNDILVHIVKLNLLKNWSPFMDKIIKESEFNESLCKNTMDILKQLSEELLCFPRGQRNLKGWMSNEFEQVFQLCQSVLENSQNAPLVDATLNTLLLFLNWIPLGDIFETKLILKLVFKFLGLPMFRNITLRCPTGIAGINVQGYEEGFKKLFWTTMTKLRQMLPTTTDMKSAYASGSNDDQNFIRNIALFLCTFFKKHVEQIEKKHYLHALLLDGHEYLVLISEVEDREIFKICLEYWKHISANLYRECPFTGGASIQIMENDSIASLGREIYRPLLSRVRHLMISRMAKPKGVLVIENEQEEVLIEYMEDTDSINRYKNMRETLVYLTRLNYMDTERIMTEKLRNQVNGTEWSLKNLNTLCWAIGSISGAMHEEDEKRFLDTVLRDVFELQKRGIGNEKKFIAASVMFIVGQYPRFLCGRWSFLKIVVNKLFELMHETHYGMRVTACDIFIKIAKKCSQHFVQMQDGEVRPFIEEIINNIIAITGELHPKQIHTFYEAVGYMVGAQTDTSAQNDLIEKVEMIPNQAHQEMKRSFYLGALVQAQLISLA